MNYLEDNTLTQKQLRNRKKRKTLLLWQGKERQKVDRFVLVKAPNSCIELHTINK